MIQNAIIIFQKHLRDNKYNTDSMNNLTLVLIIIYFCKESLYKITKIYLIIKNKIDNSNASNSEFGVEFTIRPFRHPNL